MTTESTLARGPEAAPREPAHPQSNRAMVADLYRRKREQGLVDVKFFVGNRSEAVTEIVCGEILELEAAVSRSATRPLVFDDRH